MGVSKLKGVFWIVALLAIGAVFVYRNEISDYFSPRVENLESAALNTAVQEIKKQFSAPPPLRLPTRKLSAPSAPPIAPKIVAPTPQLTTSGTIKWTNIQRNNNDLPPLSRNATLDDIAALRAKDMFDKQYFAHISPLGAGAESVAKEVGYDYLSLGENLALGNFKDDADLVQAWMNSPGHRANILNSHYTEIGVAVKKGIFADSQAGSEPRPVREGDSVWIAVQIFGKPASACPMVDQSLKAQIESNETQLNNLQAILAVKKQEIENTKNREEYNQKTEEYNALIAQYNNLLGPTKALIASYNSEVSAYNQCIAQ